MRRVAETLSAPMGAHPVAYAVLVGAVLVILCSLHGGLEPSIRGFRRRAQYFGWRYGLPVALLQVLLHRWLVGR